MQNNKFKLGLLVFFLVLGIFFGFFYYVGDVVLDLPADSALTWTQLAFFTTAFALICLSGFWLFLNGSMGHKNRISIPIHAAPQGKVQIQGVVSNLNDQLIKAPLTGRDCYWYGYGIDCFNAKREEFTVAYVQSGSLLKLSDGTDDCYFQFDSFLGGWQPNSSHRQKHTKLSDITAEELQPIIIDLIKEYGDVACVVYEKILSEGQTLYLSGTFKTVDKAEFSSAVQATDDGFIKKGKQADISSANLAQQQQWVAGLTVEHLHIMCPTSLAKKTILTVTDKGNEQISKTGNYAAWIALILFIIAGIFLIVLCIEPAHIVSLFTKKL